MIPTTMVQGDSYSWEESESDYPASTWTIHYTLVNASERIAFNSIADGDNHDFALTTTITAAWKPGDYNYTRYATDGTDRTTLTNGSVTINPDFIIASDQRSHSKKVLDAIEAVIEERATVDQEEYSINGRSLKRMTIKDLIYFRNYYANKVRCENGLNNKVWVRF